MDKAVGDLVAGLKQRGVFDNTLDPVHDATTAATPRLARTAAPMVIPPKAASNWFCGESWAFRAEHALPPVQTLQPRGRHQHPAHRALASRDRRLLGRLVARTQATSSTSWPPAPMSAVPTYPKEFKGKPITPMAGASLKPLLGLPI